MSPSTANLPVDISVVVPVYNEEKRLEECLAALLSQDFLSDRYEIILVDNNSTDRSAEIIRKHPSVLLLSQHIQGDWAARNEGIARSRGGIIAFTDADTAPARDWLRGIAETMRNPDVGIALGKVEFKPDSTLLSIVASYESEKARYIFARTDKTIYFVHACNMAVRKVLFDRIGLFVGIRRGSDTVFARRVLDEYSCESARYSTDCRVRRLEVSSIREYFRKVHVYGRDVPTYAGMAAVRPLHTRERLRVFRRLIQRERYSASKTLLSAALLAIGAVCYDAGRVRAFLDRTYRFRRRLP